IFRRADKNDDGKLSFEEFKNYFADGILSSEELWELFSGIDRRHSDNVDTEKLCGMCFLPWKLSTLRSWQPWTKPSWVLPGDTVSGSIAANLCVAFLSQHKVFSTKQRGTKWGFRGRVWKDIKKSETSVGLRSGRRCGRRGQKNVCLSPTDPYSGMLTTDPSCGFPSGAVLARHCFVPQQGGSREGRRGRLVPDAACPLSLLSTSWWQRGRSRWRRAALRSFARRSGPTRRSPLGRAAACTCQAPRSCPHSVSACKLTDEACFILYEFWQDVTSWRSHLQSSCSKTFQRAIISLLESPELLTTMLFPASWWIMNNN
ncbi:N-terminal EF-hand calcium-binding protein 3, partial [Gavia stellata]